MLAGGSDGITVGARWKRRNFPVGILRFRCGRDVDGPALPRAGMGQATGRAPFTV